MSKTLLPPSLIQHNNNVHPTTTVTTSPPASPSNTSPPSSPTTLQLKHKFSHMAHLPFSKSKSNSNSNHSTVPLSPSSVTIPSQTLSPIHSNSAVSHHHRQKQQQRRQRQQQLDNNNNNNSNDNKHRDDTNNNSRSLSNVHSVEKTFLARDEFEENVFDEIPQPTSDIADYNINSISTIEDNQLPLQKNSQRAQTEFVPNTNDTPRESSNVSNIDERSTSNEQQHEQQQKQNKQFALPETTLKTSTSERRRKPYYRRIIFFRQRAARRTLRRTKQTPDPNTTTTKVTTAANATAAATTTTTSDEKESVQPPNEQQQQQQSQQTSPQQSNQSKGWSFNVKRTATFLAKHFAQFRQPQPQPKPKIVSQVEFRRTFRKQSRDRIIEDINGESFRLIDIPMNGDCGFASISHGINFANQISFGKSYQHPSLEPFSYRNLLFFSSNNSNNNNNGKNRSNDNNNNNNNNNNNETENNTSKNKKQKQTKELPKKILPEDVRSAMHREIQSKKQSYLQEFKRNSFTEADFDRLEREVSRTGLSGHWLGAILGLLEHVIISRALNINIYLYQFDLQRQGVRQFEDATVDNPQCHVYLFFTGPPVNGHFDVLIKNSSSEGKNDKYVKSKKDDNSNNSKDDTDIFEEEDDDDDDDDGSSNSTSTNKNSSKIGSHKESHVTSAVPNGVHHHHQSSQNQSQNQNQNQNTQANRTIHHTDEKDHDVVKTNNIVEKSSSSQPNNNNNLQPEKTNGLPSKDEPQLKDSHTS